MLKVQALVQASMGPRSCERGSDQVSVLGRDVWGLQWGRVRVNAEVSQSVVSPTVVLRFNGAAFV